MVRYKYRGSDGSEQELDAEKAAELMSAVSGTEFQIVKEPLWKRLSLMTAQVAFYTSPVLLFLTVSTVALFGWEFAEESGYTADEMYTTNYYIKVLSFKVYTYETTKITKEERTRNLIADGTLDLEINEKTQIFEYKKNGLQFPKKLDPDSLENNTIEREAKR